MPTEIAGFPLINWRLQNRRLGSLCMFEKIFLGLVNPAMNPDSAAEVTIYTELGVRLE
jgi:hypothetical protein